MSKGISNLDEQDMLTQENEVVKLIPENKNLTRSKKRAQKRNSSKEEKEVKNKLLSFCVFFILYTSAIMVFTQWFVENYTNYTKAYNIIFNDKTLFFYLLNCLREYYYSRNTKVDELPISEIMIMLLNKTDYNFEQIKVNNLCYII